jgi:transcription antitermination factor NusG
MKGDGTSGAASYMDYVADAASYEAYQRNEPDTLLSAEALPENSSLVTFSAFARDYPDKLFPLLAQLRPEWQELFVEYWVLHKSQRFIADVHGYIQTRCWQALRIIEQTLGAFVILGTDPSAEVLRPIIAKANLLSTPCGDFTSMISLYAKSRSYAVVAKAAGVPVPTIRKIFRPAITKLLADKNVKAVAVGAYLRNLTHQASLTGEGLSKRYQARLRRIKNRRFVAPPSEESPLISFGAVATLQNTPWCMLEISSENHMAQVYPKLKAQGKRVFGKHPAQIYAPVNAEGELAFGYLFARSDSVALVRALTRIRGISEVSSIYNDEGTFLRAITVPHVDVQKMISAHKTPVATTCRVKDFVEILTGPARNYWGTVWEINKSRATVQVQFPSGRQFKVKADISALRSVKIPLNLQSFWGKR